MDSSWEPEEGDYFTEDHIHFYQYEKLVVEVLNEEDDWRPYIKTHMEEQKFWPNVWFVSDHGNFRLLSPVEEL